MIRKLTKDNCIKYTGLLFEDIIALTGITAFHDVKDLMFTEGELDDDIVDIEFETDCLELLTVRINLRRKTIKNVEIHSTGKIKNIGYQLLSSQIDHARRLGFKTITLNAFGDPSIKNEYSGFIVWGKLGYQMDDVSQAKFEQLMRSNDRPEKDLFELLSSKEGKTFWENNGFQ